VDRVGRLVTKFSPDPDLAAKGRDVIRLYPASPERAMVLSLDKKTQIQALVRTVPMLPMKPGHVERTLRTIGGTHSTGPRRCSR
jgi:hypothetical protein